MIQARTWPVRAIYLLIALALAVSLAMIASPAKVDASPGFLTEWCDYKTPTWGGWKIAECSQIFHYGGTAGGETMYAVGEGYYKNCADLYDVEPQLWKTTDSANSWTHLSTKVEKELDDQNIADDITEIKFEKVTCDPLEPDFMAVAFSLVADPTELHVFVSENGGSTFKDTGDIEDLTAVLTELMFMTCSTEVDGDHNLALSGIGSKDLNDDDDVLDAGETQVGLVFRYETGLGSGWEDATEYNGWDNAGYGGLKDGDMSVAVPVVWFASSFATDSTVLVTTLTAYPASGASPAVWGKIYLQTGTWGKKEGWNEEVTFAPAVLVIEDVFIPALSAATAGISLPVDYAGRHISKRMGWISVNYILDVEGDDPPTLTEDDIPMGEIYVFEDDAVRPVIQQINHYPWLASVRYWGYIDEGKAIAGLMGDGIPSWKNYGAGFSFFMDYTECCEGVQVYRNDSIVDMDICCKAWKASCKPPTGRSAAGAFFVSDKKAYAVVGTAPRDGMGQPICYDESAWSVSFDDGKTWNQISLIDTKVDFLSDAAKSPNCNKTMLVSINADDTCCDCFTEAEEYVGCDSTWMKADELKDADEYSGKWFRTWNGILEGDYGLLRLAPEEENGETVYLVDWLTDTVYWNDNETLACWEEGHSTIEAIVDLGVKDEATIYALDLDTADVAVSDDHGATATWDDPVSTAAYPGHTIFVLGDNVFVGGESGKVAYSDDGGDSYTKLPKKTPIEANVHIMPDTYYTENDTIFAAVSGAGGVYRWVIGESHQWTDLNASHQGYYGIQVSPFHNKQDGNPMTKAAKGGVLYAAYGYGVARALDAADTPCCLAEYWNYLEVSCEADYLEYALCEGFYLEPSTLKICGCLSPDTDVVIWAIDQYVWWEGDDVMWDNGYDYDSCVLDCGRLWYFTDCFSKGAPTLVAPADGSMIPADPCICTNDNFILKWERMCEACDYDVFIAKDPNVAYEIIVYDRCYSPPSGAGPTYVVMEGDLDCATTYYWRVRVCAAESGQAIRSFKSDIWSFTIAAGPQAGVFLTAPDDGTTNVPLAGVTFTWTAVQNADSYDFVLSANADLSNPVESKTGLTAAAYAMGATLENDTSYFWQVVAKKGANVLSTSNMSTFSTAPEAPPPPPEPAEPTTPTWVWVVIAIGAVLVIVVIVLIFRTRRV